MDTNVMRILHTFVSEIIRALKSLYITKISALFAIAIGISLHTTAQCIVNAHANPDTVCSGNAVDLSFQYSCDSSIFYIGFNAGELGPDAEATSGVIFTNPCDTVAPPAGPHCWFGGSAFVPRFLSTIPVNINSYAYISFLMRYADDENPVDCEDPDLPGEGVHFQYSLSPYTSWTDISYWVPNSISSGPLYAWSTYMIEIPSNIINTTVKFRWIQEWISGGNFDNWGIDEIRIFSSGVTSASWSDGYTGFGTHTIYPTSDTTIVLTVTDSTMGLTTSDTISIQVLNEVNELYVSACDSYMAPDNTILTSSGTYTYTFPGAVCDSVVILHLFINTTPDSYLYADSVTLTAPANCTYQWVECPAFSIIPGETNQSFTSTHSGYFSCIITQYNCTDTLACYPLYPAEIIENSFSGEISVFPNPTEGRISIHFSHNLEAPEITILDASGKIISKKKLHETNIIEDEILGNPGVYFVQVISGEDKAVFKLSKK